MKRFLVVLFAALTASVAFGQVTSRVTGLVQDSSGAVVTDASVTLTNEATNVPVNTTTTSAGSYVFDGMQPGSYRVTIEKSGFSTFIASGNVLTIGQPMVINANLQIGANKQAIEVVSAAQAVQTDTSGNIGNLVDQVSVTTLPIVGSRGRSPLDLLELQPGVVDAGGFNSEGTNVAGGGVHVNGSRDRAWNYTLDGIDINETSAGGSNFSPLRTNPDSISQFRVLTSNFTSEYGRNSGAQVEMITRSGANQFHGTAFYFYQTPGLNANDTGNKMSTPPIGRPQFVQRIPGGSIGGPIIKNKTFFFFNVQTLHTRQSFTNTSTVYTAAARRGLFRYVTGCGGNCRNVAAGALGAVVDANGNPLGGVSIGNYDIAASDPAHLGLDPQIQSILNKTPLPNNFAVGDGLNLAGYTFPARQVENQVDWTIKVDHNINDKNSIFVRWAMGHQNTEGDTANGGLAPFPNATNIVDTQRQPRNLAAAWRSTISPVLTNELVLGLNRFSFNFVNPDPSAAKNPPYILNDITMPLQNYVGNKRALTTYQLVDNVSYAHSAHVFKSGINFRYQRHIDDRGSIGNFDAAPAVYFDTATNSVDPVAFNLPVNSINTTYDLPVLNNAVNNLLGRFGEIDQGLVAATSNQFAPPGTLLQFDFRMPEYDFYGQDTWHIRKNLVIDYGLRWEIKLAPNDTKNRILRPAQPFDAGAPPGNTIRWVQGQLYNSSFGDLGPSVGIAWDPFSDGKTSIRANYRLAYDRINTFSLSAGIFQGLPGETLQESNFDGGRIATGVPLVTAPAGLTPESLQQPVPFSKSAITAIDPHWKAPQVSQWAFGVQRELPGRVIAEANYIGHHGVHLYGGYDANQVDIRNNGFLDAFNTVAAGKDSPLIDSLLANDSRVTPGETGSQYLRDPAGVYYPAFHLGSVAGVANQMGLHTENGKTLPQLAGLSPFFFFPYPQFAGGFNVLDSHDISSYEALQIEARRAFSNGLTFQASYSLAKSMDTRSFDPTFTTVARGSSTFGASSTPFDLSNRRLNYAPSDFDRRHVFQSNWVYQLPFGKGRQWANSLNPVLDRIVDGWEVAGVVIVESGRPTTVFSPANTISNVVNTPANCSGCSSDMFQIVRDGQGSLNYLTPAEMAKFSTPEPGEFSNVGRNFFRLSNYATMNMSIGKITRIRERHTLETRLEIQNVTNSVFFDQPASARIDSPNFGSANAALIESFGLGLASSPRTMQLSAKYSF